ADAEFAPGDAGDDLVLDGERRAGRGVANFVVCDPGLPAQTARAGIERNQVCIEAGVVDRVAKYRDAAVYAATAQAEILGKFPAVGPVAAASASVQRHDFVGRLGDVQDAVDRDGRSFNGVRLMDLMDPGDPEAVSVGGVDLPSRGSAADKPPGFSGRWGQCGSRELRCLETAGPSKDHLRR